ncbi:MAG: transposase [Burkholderiales bacterium]|jgi:DNA replication protein DnaC|nr:transposase [Burkholderiales bacterium]
MINNISQSCEVLKLNGVLQCYQSIADECSKLKASYTEYLEQILNYELAIRQQRSKDILLKMSGFPVLKTLEQFDFSCSNINKMQIQELANLQFIANKQNVIFIGSAGIGKTHLAISIGYLATLQRIKVKFLTAADLLINLEAAQMQNKLSIYLSKVLGTAGLVIIDEFGYLKFTENQANLFFQLINKRYEVGSIMITSNLTFSQWQGVLNNDEALSAAIMDRLIHHSHIVNINGESYRLKQKRKAGIIPVKMT